MPKSLLAGLATLAGPWLILAAMIGVQWALRIKDYSLWTVLPFVLCPIGLAAGYWLAGHPGRGMVMVAIGLGLALVGGGIGFFLGAGAPTEDAGLVAMALMGIGVLIVMGPFALWAAFDAAKLAR